MELTNDYSLFDLNFEPLSKNPDDWDVYELSITGEWSLCGFGEHLAKALKRPSTYSTKTCSVCPEDFRNYCKDVTSILRKYSSPLPDNIKIEKKKQ